MSESSERRASGRRSRTTSENSVRSHDSKKSAARKKEKEEKEKQNKEKEESKKEKVKKISNSFRHQCFFFLISVYIKLYRTTLWNTLFYFAEEGMVWLVETNSKESSTFTRWQYLPGILSIFHIIHVILGWRPSIIQGRVDCLRGEGGPSDFQFSISFWKSIRNGWVMAIILRKSKN